MFEPMWDPKVLTVGFDARAFVVGLAVIPFAIGFIWMRRVTGGDPEPDSFWATTRARSRLNATVKAGLVLAAVAVALFLFRRP